MSKLPPDILTCLVIANENIKKAHVRLRKLKMSNKIEEICKIGINEITLHMARLANCEKAIQRIFDGGRL